MRIWKNVSLAIKLNIIVLLAFVILLVSVVALLSHNTRNLTQEIGTRRAAEEAVVLQSRLAETGQQLTSNARFLGAIPDLITATENHDERAARTALARATLNLELDNIDVVDVNGNTIANMTVDSITSREEGTRLISLGLLGIETTDLLITAEDGEWEVRLVAVTPLRTSEATIVGTLLISQKIDTVFLEGLNFERKSIHLGVVYENQIVVRFSAEGDTGDALPRNILTKGIAFDNMAIQQALKGQAVIMNSIVENEDRLPEAVAYIPLFANADGSPAALMILIDLEEIANFQVTSQQNTILVFVGIALLSLTIITVAVYLTTLHPLNQIKAVAQAMTNGHYEKRIANSGRDEIGQLGDAFNVMARVVQEREAGLAELNQSLEYRVAERTAELKVARDEALTSQRIAMENSRLKSEFLSTMSHELRTPLNAIEGFTSIMLGGMGIELNPRAESMVKRVSANSKRLLHLINDFLDLSRIESGRMELVKTPLSPQRLSQRWQEEVGILAEEKEIDFIVNVSPDMPPMILGDEDALSKIAINLLSNAFKFTHEGQVSLDLERANGSWTITVRDTGIGIPSHAREYIFDEFRQVDASSKRLYGGTGLGLALVQKLSRAMGGTVTLDSELGKGSTFTVISPLEIPKESEKGTIT